VRIEGNEVWLNPTPYSEGTERPGAVIDIENVIPIAVGNKIENVKKEKNI